MFCFLGHLVIFVSSLTFFSYFFNQPAILKRFCVIFKVCNEKMLEMEKRKKKSKKSLLEAKALQNKNLISTFKAGGAVPNMGGGSRGFQRSGQRLDAFRSRPPNTSRPPSLHVDDFLVLQSRGQQPTGPTGYNKQTLKAAQELFAQREAKKGAVGFREATKEPVSNNK